MDQLVPRLATEWLNGNQHRAYPLDDSTNSSTSPRIPTALLVDALFFNVGDIDSERLYISSVVQDGDNILLFMGGFINNEAVDFGLVSVIPYSTALGTRIEIYKTITGNVLHGVIVIGDTRCMDGAPPIIELDEKSGLIFPGCVRIVGSSGLYGISVNGVLYSGTVTLVAGDGIEFDIKDTVSGTEIIISSTAYRVPYDNNIIVDDNELLQRAMDMYGKPVTTICGVEPDTSGNISLVVKDKDNQYVAASKIGPGAISLTIANDTTNTQCIDTSDQVESLAISISNLNIRSGEMHEGIQAMDNAISNLALQVSRG